jgi:hypothetical protein
MDPDPGGPETYGSSGSGSSSATLVKCMDLDPDPSIILLSSSKNRKKNLDSYSFVISFRFFFLKNVSNVPSKSNQQKNFFLT